MGGRLAALGRARDLGRERLALRVARNAERQIREASAWSHLNRLAARGLFRRELQRVFELILSQLASGAIAADVELPDVRRVFLDRTRYDLYYRVDEVTSPVDILAIWHTKRGAPTEL